MSDKPYWFKWYPLRWFGSINVSTMTLEEQGAYFRLLCHSYPNGLPDDEELLKELLERNQGGFKGSLMRLMKMFVNIDGRLYHELLLDEYANYKKVVEGGRSGGLKTQERARLKEDSDSVKGASRVGSRGLQGVEKSREEKKKKKEKEKRKSGKATRTPAVDGPGSVDSPHKTDSHTAKKTIRDMTAEEFEDTHKPDPAVANDSLLKIRELFEKRFPEVEQ